MPVARGLAAEGLWLEIARLRNMDAWRLGNEDG